MSDNEPMFPDHSDHGRGSVEEGPDDLDCPCRTTSDKYECSRQGCGFCESAVNNEPLPIICGRCYDEVNEKNLFPANCAEKPEKLTNAAIGMYHCPDCGAMILAGMPHPNMCHLCIDRKHPYLDDTGDPQ